MKNLTKFLALVMVLAMVFCMAACATENPDGTTEDTSANNTTTAPSTSDPAPSSEPADDGMKTYTVTVKDSEGNPLSGVMMQICLDSCMPGVTDANGVATFVQKDASGYSVGVSADYENTKVYYEDGQYDVTIVWDGAEAE